MYIISSGKLKVSIPMIEHICSNKRLLEFDSATLTFANNTDSFISTDLDSPLSSHGISLDFNQSKAWLQIESTDQTDSETSFNLAIRSFVEEEPTWFNITHITIHFVLPNCFAIQDKFTQIQQPSITLSAIGGVSRDEIDLTETIQSFQIALENSQSKDFCGPVGLNLVHS